jgi:hypothetical protein
MSSDSTYEFRHILVVQPDAVPLLEQATATSPEGDVTYNPDVRSEFRSFAHLVDADGFHPIVRGLSELVPLAEKVRNLGGQVVSLTSQHELDPTLQVIPRLHTLLAGQAVVEGRIANGTPLNSSN